MAAFLRIRERNRIRRERIFRDRLDPLAVPEEDLISKYRLPRAEIVNLIELLGEDLERATNRNHSVPVAVQVATSLRFFASGTFQNVLGDSCGLSQPTMSRIINSFTESLVRRVNEFVYLPAGREKRKTIAEFAAVGNFPNVLGVIDGTHVPIKSPSENEHLYINRKNFHSINVQLVCDKNYFVMDVVSKWPGSTHDSFILRTSSLSQLFENGIITDGWLLGDSGYPSKPWLLTPLRNPVSPEELRYNTSHRTTRCIIERCIGVLKSRFRCLHSSGGSLQYGQSKCCKIIVAAVILHNICILSKVPFLGDIVNDPDDNQEEVANHDGVAGQQVRRRLIAEWFGN